MTPPARYLFATQFTVYIYAYDKRIHRRHLPFGCRMFKIISLNLNGTYRTLGSIHIGTVVHFRTVLLLQLNKHLRELVERLALKTLP